MPVTGVTEYAETLDVGNVPRWFTFDVAGQVEEGSGGVSETFKLMDWPIGTIMVDATICCIVAGAGTGTDVLSLQEDGADRAVFTGTADNGGAVDVMDRALVVDGSFFPITTAVGVEALRTISDDVTTPASYRVSMLLLRNTRG